MGDEKDKQEPIRGNCKKFFTRQINDWPSWIWFRGKNAMQDA